MTEGNRSPVRILIVDDDADVREAYRDIFRDLLPAAGRQDFERLRQRLQGPSLREPAITPATLFAAGIDCVLCPQGEAAVAVLAEALALDRPFAIVFLDAHMPPGPDGIWAAQRIRELDPAVEIVVCTAHADTALRELAASVPPEEKLSYLQKPFHPQEILQLAISLTSKWRSEQRIIELTYFDSLTGLPNRDYSRRRMQSAVKAANADGGTLAVMYLDIDNFRRVNDTLGHTVGDELLCVIASRLQHALRSGDTVSADSTGTLHLGDVARFSGDEFIALLPNLPGAEPVGTIIERVIAQIRKPLCLARHVLVVSASIGVAMYPADGEDVETLLRNAELAMYAVKRRNPGTFAFYSPSMNSGAMRRFAIEEQLREALERQEFSLHYQPQFDVRSGTIAGMEALLRWNNADLGEVSPLEFIAVAEESDLILHIGDWVLREACLQAKAWRRKSLPLVRMAVNVSGRQFALPTFPESLATVLHETGLEPATLEIEITESAVMKDEVWAEQALAKIKRLGVSVAIDDFGTGYSSFGRLRQFAVNRLKIDRSFITDIVDSSDDRAIAVAIIGMARALRIEITAEGVETFAQLKFLQEHQCHEAQGYLFSRPLPAAAAQRLLQLAADTDGATRTQRLHALIE